MEPMPNVLAIVVLASIAWIVSMVVVARVSYDAGVSDGLAKRSTSARARG